MTPPTFSGYLRAGPVLIRPGVGGVVSVADTLLPTVTGGVVTVITPPVGGVTVMTPPRRHPPTAVTTPLALGGGGLAHHPKQHPRVTVPEALRGVKRKPGNGRPLTPHRQGLAPRSPRRTVPAPAAPPPAPATAHPPPAPSRRFAGVPFADDRGEVAVASVNWRKRGKRYLVSWHLNCSGRTTTNSSHGLASEASG